MSLNTDLYTLSEEEMWLCRMAASARRYSNRVNKIDDKTVSKDKLYAELCGVMGEHLFGKMTGTFVRYFHTPQAGSADSDYLGWGVDVKATWDDSKPLWIQKLHEGVDMYCLMIVAGETVRMKGWATKNEVLRNCTKEKYGLTYLGELHTNQMPNKNSVQRLEVRAA